MGKIAISKIEIQIGKNKMELSIEEAQELKKILNETFPEKEFQFIPSTPVVIYPSCPQQRRWNDWQVTWTGSELVESETIAG